MKSNTFNKANYLALMQNYVEGFVIRKMIGYIYRFILRGWYLYCCVELKKMFCTILGQALRSIALNILNTEIFDPNIFNSL